MKNEEEFLDESNKIEGVYDMDSFQQALYSWDYIKDEYEYLSTCIMSA